MPIHQYVQHDWPPALWATMLTIMATLVVVGMGLFLVGASRPKALRPGTPLGSETQERPRLDAGTLRPARLDPLASLASRRLLGANEKVPPG